MLQNQTMVGELKFEIGYSQSTLFLTIIECRVSVSLTFFTNKQIFFFTQNLRYKHDTCVQLFFRPGRHAEIMTKVVKKDANPLFVETIKFQVPLESLLDKTIVLHVIDLKTSSRGEIQIPLNSIDFNQISTFVMKIGPVTL